MKRSSEALAMLLGIGRRPQHIFECASGILTSDDLILRANLLAEKLPYSRQRVIIPSDDPIALLCGIAGCWMSDNTAVAWRKSALNLDALSELTDAKASIRFEASDWQIDRLGTRDLAVEQPGDLIIMTSGSTGKPKGVSLDLKRVVVNAALAGSKVGVSSASVWTVDADMSLMSPLGHTFMAWLNQVPVLHMSGMDWASRSDFFNGNNAGFGGAPLQIRELIQRIKGDGPKIIVSSGDFLPPALGDAVGSRLPNTKLHKIYGLTEVSGRLCVLPHEERLLEPASAGFPLPGFEVSIDASDEVAGSGEILVSGPTLMCGYWRNQTGFAPVEASIFRTGDLGTVSENGLVTVNGRQDDVFKVGAEKVDRLSIEQALQADLKGFDFCVLPVIHHVLGQTPVLFMALKDGISLPTRESLIRAVRTKLPSRFMPSMMLSTGEALPKLSNGKLDKQLLINNYAKFPDIYAK